MCHVARMEKLPGGPPNPTRARGAHLALAHVAREACARRHSFARFARISTVQVNDQPRNHGSRRSTSDVPNDRHDRGLVVLCNGLLNPCQIF